MIVGERVEALLLGLVEQGEGPLPRLAPGADAVEARHPGRLG